MHKYKKWLLALFSSFCIFFACKILFQEIDLRLTAYSRERTFLSLSLALRQFEFDKSNMPAGGYKIYSLSELLKLYADMSESDLIRAAYGDRKHVPTIVFESGNPMRIYETKAYPVSSFKSDRLEVNSNGYAVRWVKSGKIVKP